MKLFTAIATLGYVVFTLGCSAAGPGTPGEKLYTFTAAPGLEDLVAGAGDSLNQASGLAVAEGSGGIEVGWWNDQDDGVANDCAHTVILFDKTRDNQTISIRIAVKEVLPEGCVWPLQVIVEHEMIHALTNWGRATGNQNGEHSTHGLFQAYDMPGDSALEETSLAALCALAPCTEFNPEAPEPANK